MLKKQQLLEIEWALRDGKRVLCLIPQGIFKVIRMEMSSNWFEGRPALRLDGSHVVDATTMPPELVFAAAPMFGEQG